MTLTTLLDGYRAAVFGATGGIGEAFVRALAEDPRCGHVYAAARRPGDGAGKVSSVGFDLTDEASIAGAVSAMAADGPLDLVIVATGILHSEALLPEKTYRALDAAAMANAFAINAIGPALIAKHALPHLARERKAVFAALSARVGSISDNGKGGWHAYRASKAALNMLMRNFAIELALRNRSAACVALHPGTVDTRLSQPFQVGVPAAQLFSPEHSVSCLLRVIESLTAEKSGALYAWNGETIPF